MVVLLIALHYFVHLRLNNDPGWKNIKISYEMGRNYLKMAPIRVMLSQGLEYLKELWLLTKKLGQGWLTGMLYLVDELLDASISDISFLLNE
ncbi:hypothetical protein DEO72_LG4g441 [Vigna unguiculata]|uniref:Uncharacterized protein n=1 Tax=Vigna unguiculata TaxID=3917 RepID=A0A4D6LMM2_VIGUN|nr:hypothetical protein DEO72_LG4g441 [Vigna unguiculata]